MRIFDPQCMLTVRRSSQTETYLVESPNIKYLQLYRVSHFNPTGIARHSFFFKYNFNCFLLSYSHQVILIFNAEY
jgi:hypothetical protein